MAGLFGDHLFDVFKSKKNVQPLASNEQETPISEEDLARANEIVSSILDRKRDLETDNNDDQQPTKKLHFDDTDSKCSKNIPKITIHTLDTVEACTHEVAVPSDFEYTPLRPLSDKPIKTFPFTLDPFQKEAILCLENNQSVLVSAHTSAGKTVVAEYVTAMSLQNNQRVIYTTPIKALSNQKFREFSNEFKDVGLMTGDVTINPSASCLVMTTEILRSMLYRGSEVTREVGWVIFDEIHYMRNVERGVVWEETIILLPSSVHFVFLSATIPNARQFAEWICHLHNQPCHVVYTDYRPVPLQHYIFPAGGDGLFLVVDDNGEFREENFNKAMAVLQTSIDVVKGDSKRQKGGTKGDSNCFKIVKMIMERNFAPVIVFSFSKKECEAYAVLMSKLDFNTDDEKTLVDEVFSNAMDILSEEDRKLPQIEHILPLLRRGIGIHHSGLLPIIKETVEILFGEGLIKALFATETFAMGLNMPARTVLFTNPRKFDGKDFRWLSSGEYIQMSGRAGRRGIDDKGIIILMIAETMASDVGKSLVKGQADPLNSAFHLTYNMVLNLLRVEEINPEYILEKSFYQFQNYVAIPGLEEKVNNLKEKYDEIKIDREDDVASYQQLKLKHAELSVEFQNYLTNPKYILKFLQPGRMVKVCNNGVEFDWGIVVSYKKKPDTKGDPTIFTPNYIIDVLLHVSPESTKTNKTSVFKPCPPNEKGEMKVVPVLINLIMKISVIRLSCPQDLRPYDDRMNVLKLIQKVEQRFPEGVPLLDPIEDMGINEEGFKNVIIQIESIEICLLSHPLYKSEDREKLCEEFERKTKVSNELKMATTALKKAESLLQMDDLKCRKRVLRRLGYCNAADVIEIKGKVACEIDSGDELVLTELLFSGVFNDLTIPQTVALLSCFVFKEKSNEQMKISNELAKPFRQMQEMARHIAILSAQSRLDVEEEKYVKRFRPQLMDVVFAWSQKAKFEEICKMTDVHEGNVIRCLRSLDELLQQLTQASRVMGNIDLEQKFCKGIEEIKRGIVFAVSLYL